MRRILCFGDSLTWGYSPIDGIRYDEGIRWTSVLQKELGDEYRIVEEGQNARTIAIDDPSEGEKNGMKYIIPCIESAWPLDMIIVMLGTNDTKKKFSLSSIDIANEMEEFICKAESFIDNKYGRKVKMILMAPPCIGQNMNTSRLGDVFGDRSPAISAQLPDLYRDIACKHDIYYVDSNQYVSVSPIDSCHIDDVSHVMLGKALAGIIEEIM